MDFRRWSSISGVLAVAGLVATACDQGVGDPVDRIGLGDVHVSPGHEEAIVDFAEDALASLPPDPLAAVAPECAADHVETVTTNNVVCDGDIMCVCFDAQGTLSFQGPLQLGQQCNVPPGGVCTTAASPAMQSCAVAEASTPDPQCPANCTAMGPVSVSSVGGPPNCCTATKSIDCCCPDADDETDPDADPGAEPGADPDADAVG